MSAFVVGDDCISRAVYGLRLVEPFLWHKKETELGRQLLTMNIEAVRQRYDDDAVLGENAEKYEYVELAPSAVVAWKALQCLIYQCSEGNIPERDLYKNIVAYSEKLGAIILAKRKNYKDIWDMPECVAAPWGD